MHSYEIEIRALDGTVTRSFVRDAPWFPPQVGRSSTTTVVDVKAISPSIIAVFIGYLDPDAGELTREAPTDLTLDGYQNTVIEVLDLTQGRVLARTRLDAAVTGTVCPTGEIVASVKGDAPWDHLRFFYVRFTHQQ